MMLLLYRFLYLAALVIPSAAPQELASLLASRPELSNLSSFLGLYPTILQSSTNLTNFTLLAPNNNAWTKLLNSSFGTQFAANDTTFVQALFAYHTINGTNNLSEVQKNITYINTNLNYYLTPTYSQYFGNPVLGSLSAEGQLAFYSGLNTQSNLVTAVCDGQRRNRIVLTLQQNLTFDGGVVHIIDTFLTLPQSLTTTLNTFGLTAAEGAFLDAGSDLTLPMYITAFMPTNAAFEAVGSVFNNVTASELASILAYHFVESTWFIDYVLGRSKTALNSTLGSTLQLTNQAGLAFINNAQITLANVLIFEGILDVIDKCVGSLYLQLECLPNSSVLNPSNTAAVPDVTATSQTPGYSGATALANNAIPFTSGLTAPTSSTSTSTFGRNSTHAATSATRSAPPSTSSAVVTPALGLSGGAKAGIGVGVAVGVIAIIAIVAFLIFRRRQNRAPSEVPHPKEPEISPPEKYLAAELATKREHAGELHSDSKSDAFMPVHGREELQGHSIGPELPGQMHHPHEIGGEARLELE